MKRSTIFFFCFCFTTIAAQSQEDCNLGLGSGHHEQIIRVFQLTENQQENLKNWGAELKFRNEVFKFRAERLLQSHPQKSPEDLLRLSLAYKALLDSMRYNLRMLDERMLGTFTNSQYNLYIELCNGVARRPIYADRGVGPKKKNKS